MKFRFTLNNTKAIFVTMLSAMLIGSCTSNFDDINKKPNEPDDEQIALIMPWALFPQMLNYAYPSQENAYQMGENLIGDPYGRYLSISNSGFTSNFSIFNAPSSWINSPYKDAFSNVYGVWMKIQQNFSTEEIPVAWAKILRVVAMQRLTDMYGPIPYSKVGSGGIVTPFDSQELVYKGMFKDLDEAIETFTKNMDRESEFKMMTRFDKVYDGKFTKWIKFANSMKLRMAMRIVYADPALAKQKAEEAIGHPVGVIENNGDNARNAYPQNPVWTVVDSWSDSRVCADIIAYMDGYNDPRMNKYFTKSQIEGGGEYLGLRTGIKIPGKITTDKYSKAIVERQTPTLWMNAAEVAFIRAEGSLRGWNMGGTAADFYEQGVQLSFTQWDADKLKTYLDDSTSKPGGIKDPNSTFAAAPISTITIKWSESDPFETKLERIITQKWIAMFPLGQEAWSEQRRTGYPHFYPVLVNSNEDTNLTTRLASRIPFPPDEKDNNTTNYNEAVKLLGGADNYSTKLWWDKNPNKGW